MPGGLRAPSLQSIPPEVIAKDDDQDGNFLPFSKWTSQGITYKNITSDKLRNPKRRCLVSLGGATNHGGTFGIQQGMSVLQWVSNATKFISSLSADGAEMQFEGNTEDPNFQEAMTLFLEGLKSKGFLTAIGPYYGGTWNDYTKMPMKSVDYVNLQMLAMYSVTHDRHSFTRFELQ